MPARERATRPGARDLAVSGLRFGVEIETVGLARSAVAEAVASVVAPGCPLTDVIEQTIPGAYAIRAADRRLWKVLADGSLAGGGAEIVSPILEGEADLDLLQAVVRAIRAAGARSSAADGCGIHVHVDAPPTGPELANLLRLVARHEELLVAALQVDPQRRQWCRPLEQTGVIAALARTGHASRDAVAQAWYGDDNAASSAASSRYHPTRYHGLNLHSVWYRGTVEFRWFNGTLHAGRVKAYVLLALALLVRASKPSTTQSRPLDLGDNAKFRVARFLGYELGIQGRWAVYRDLLTGHLPGAGRQRVTA